MKKTILFFALIFSAIISFAQPLSVIKAEKAFEAKKYEKCVKLSVKGIKKDKTIIELLYIKTKAEYELSLIVPQKEGETNWAKECIKSAIKAKLKDKENEFTKKYSVLFDKIAKQNNQIALDIFNQAKYGKALPYYKNSYDLTGDTIAYGMIGICHWFNKNEGEALKIMQKVALWNFEAHEDKLHSSTYIVQAFEILASYYNKRNQSDSSLRYTEMGLEIFPKNTSLLKNEKIQIHNKIKQIKNDFGINSEANNWALRGLYYLPSDTLLLNTQNQYYLNKIGFNCEKRDYVEASKMHQEFYQNKKELALKGVKNKTDEFLIFDSLEFSGKCLTYYLSRNTEKSIVFYFLNWYPQYYKTGPITEKSLETILNNPPDFVSKRLVLALMNYASKTYPKNATFKTSRLNTFLKWKTEIVFPIEWRGLLATNDSVIKDFPKKLELKQFKESLLIQSIDSFVKYKQLDICWGQFRKLKDEYPSNKSLSKINLTLSKLDFELRYKGSKISNRKTDKGVVIAETGWNGFSKRCDYGDMPDSTFKKLETRINYFRQNAGVRDLLTLDKDRAEKCQQASVMFTPIGVFSRQPGPETHTCYSRGAGEAAMFGQMIKDPNPAISLTVLMSDEKSEELYNRQYILAPNSKKFGIGASENNTVAWITTPNDKIIDSAFYLSHFISWPPAGFCPKLFLFDKWSFSMAGDLRKAKVSIQSKTFGNIPVKTKLEQSPMVSFYTIVMTPELSEKQKSEIKEGESFTITVELSPKKKISYSSTIWLNQ
jgi:hypothetical protein